MSKLRSNLDNVLRKREYKDIKEILEELSEKGKITKGRFRKFEIYISDLTFKRFLDEYVYKGNLEALGKYLDKKIPIEAGETSFSFITDIIVCETMKIGDGGKNIKSFVEALKDLIYYIASKLGKNHEEIFNAIEEDLKIIQQPPKQQPQLKEGGEEIQPTGETEQGGEVSPIEIAELLEELERYTILSGDDKLYNLIYDNIKKIKTWEEYRKYKNSIEQKSKENRKIIEKNREEFKNLLILYDKVFKKEWYKDIFQNGKINVNYYNNFIEAELGLAPSVSAARVLDAIRIINKKLREKALEKIEEIEKRSGIILKKIGE